MSTSVVYVKDDSWTPALHWALIDGAEVGHIAHREGRVYEAFWAYPAQNIQIGSGSMKECKALLEACADRMRK